ncbi:MAG: hypothetical protein A3D94_09320 [Alphaproteobacteria bacterium RIFCSPHIGHO2_12_FULL_66_14]|jgi:uncharacterized protein (DUF433 family)|nr:MAG: hypothetical protein A3D94_09320 [Alphaproteobacteria bacterium RIFCSPHIGHO2_12_FULL_66_14]
MTAKKKSQKQRPRRLPHGLENETFSIKEAAAIAGLADKTVRNEIYVDLFRVELDDKSRVAISARGVIYLRLIHLLPVQLGPKDRNALSRMLAEGWPGAEGWVRKGDTISKGMVSLDVGVAERDAIERLRVFVRGRNRVDSDTGGPAGDMLFKDTAIRVRLVGALLARGAEPAKMLTAFPALQADDIAFAGMFARLNKGPGSASTGRARAARRSRTAR